MFYDRDDAADKLITALEQFKHEQVIILAIPRGGVPIGKKVADALNFPMDISLIKKIGHPVNPEYAIGAVGLENTFFTDADGMVTKDYVDEQVEKIRVKLKERYKKYMGNKDPLDLEQKTVVITDDGIATGSTILATIQMVRKKGAAKVIVAAPVGPPAAVRKIREEADDVICLEIPPDFSAVGQFYESFDQVSDEEVVAMLNN